MIISGDDRRKNTRRLRALLRARPPLPSLVLTGKATFRAALLAGTVLSAHAALAQTLPQGGQVAGGAASIAQRTTNQMIITQSTQRVAINWQSFNIGAGYGVQFVQPSSSAIAVNRVIGLSGPSQILGSLTANGQVYIVNPQGVVFGKGAMVNTGALLATTRDIDPVQSMAGNITLSGGSTGNGLVKNAGTITTAPGGYVILAGDRVINNGTIDAPGGRTVLAAGDQATVALSNGQLVNVTVNASVANATVKNNGVIKATGGKVVLSANGAGTVIGGAIKLAGTVDVSAALAGDITVDAGPGGTVNASGATLKAVSTAGKGGNVTLAGDRVGLFDGTKVNASGSSGGGTVLAGGGVQGKDSRVRNASVTVIDPTASVDTSATDKGDGGTVVLWSNDYTGFYGTITAQGGPNGGKGGWVETSSHDNLQAFGKLVVGEGGSWLLDPTNVTIANQPTATDVFHGGNGTWVPSGNDAVINVGEINAQLNAGTSVTVNTNSASSQSGVLNLNADITKTAGGNASLTLRSNGTLNDNGATISSTAGTLNVTLNASTGIVVANGSAFLLNGGNLTINGTSGNFIGVNIGQTTINAAAATIIGTTTNAAVAVNVFGVLNATGTPLLTINGTNGTNASVNFGAAVAAHDLVVNAHASANGNGIVVGTTLNVAGNLTLNGTANDGIGVNVAGALNASGGNITITGTSNTGRGVRLNGTIAAAGTANIAGTADDANGISVAGNLTLAAAGGATLTGTANTANGINISATLDASGTPLLTLNGCTSSGGGSDLTFFGVNISGTVNAANLTISGRGLSGVDDIGGVGLTGSIFTSGNLAIGGTANNGIAVNLAGVVNVSGGNLTINGTSNTGRGVRLSDTIVASGFVNITGSSDNANGIAVPGNLTLAAGNGAMLTGTANAANGINISATLNAAGTPLLTLNGTSSRDGNLTFYGVALPGIVNAADLTIIGRGRSGVDETGGVLLTGSACATGNVTINGAANNGIAVNLTGAVNTTGGNVTITGTSSTGRGVRLAGSIAASGTVNVIGSSGNANGLAVPANFTTTIMAGGGATLTGNANSANGMNIGGVIEAAGTPLLTLNGTSTASDGGYYGVNVSGVLNVADLTVNGLGNLNATGNVGGTHVSGAITSLGNVTVIGQSNGTFAGIFFTGDIASGGNLILNGSGNNRYGVNASGTLNAAGTVTINGTSAGKAGVLLNTSLNLAASEGATIAARSNSTSGFVFDGTLNAIGTPQLTINGTGGIVASGCLSAGGNVTLNDNLITLNGAVFRGADANVVLQALDTTSAMTVNGSGASFGNVAAIVVGSSSQAAVLNLAAPLTYAGAGNLSVATGAADIQLNANIDASAGSGSVILSAGNGVSLNASQANGNVTGGDIVVGCVSSLRAGEGGTVVIYSGNANSSAYATLVANGATSQTKAYARLTGEGDVNASSALNLFYRVAPSLAVSLGNATGVNVTKTYDGVGVGLGFNVTGGLIDGDTAGAITMSGDLGSSLLLTAGQAMHAGNYTISQGNATFLGVPTGYGTSVTNGSIVIAPKALAVTATSDSKMFDGTTSSSKLATISGAIEGDSFSDAARAQVFASSVAAGTNNSILLPASPLSNSSIANSIAGSWISDYSITYTAALGTITLASVGPTSVVVPPPPPQVDGLASANVVALGSWLNSGGQQQNIPSGLSLNDNVLHLMFTTSSTGQPLVQASWAFFNSNFSGTINLPVNVNRTP